MEQNQDGLLELQQSGQRAKCTRFVHPNNARICPPSGAAAHIGKVYIVLLSTVFLGNAVLDSNTAFPRKIGGGSNRNNRLEKGVVWGGWAMGAEASQ